LWIVRRPKISDPPHSVHSLDLYSERGTVSSLAVAHLVCVYYKAVGKNLHSAGLKAIAGILRGDKRVVFGCDANDVTGRISPLYLEIVVQRRDKNWCKPAVIVADEAIVAGTPWLTSERNVPVIELLYETTCAVCGGALVFTRRRCVPMAASDAQEYG
jgi:hypothetical protein